jgi:hypothetical protein
MILDAFFSLKTFLCFFLKKVGECTPFDVTPLSIFASNFRRCLTQSTLLISFVRGPVKADESFLEIAVIKSFTNSFKSGTI